MRKPSTKKPIIALVALFLSICIITCFWAPSLLAQSKKENLQKQRDEINEKIALTKKLIKESESNQKLTSNQLAILNEQLQYRQQLLQNINSDIRSIDGEIGNKERDIQHLTNDLSALKGEYSRMIVQAYKNRSSYDKLMYIFSARDFNQAYKRLKITQRYAEVRKKQAEQIRKTQGHIAENISMLEQDKLQKEVLASNKEKEKKEIEVNKSAQQTKLSALQKEEKKLRDQQKKQEADRKKLTAKIEDIIRQEIAEANRKAEAEAKAKAANTGSSNNKSNNTAAGNNKEKSQEKTTPKPELAPEVKALNADFEKNRGTLPWPVNAGVITQRFGRQAHASLAGIEVNSNGVDFTTDKDATVLAVFGGVVTSVFDIPGAGKNVIITHGTYKTVYSGLNTLSVSVGDKVSTKQRIGTVIFDGEEYTMHFEIWKVTSEGGVPQNPEAWIKR